MKKILRVGAQGDVFFVKVDSGVPADAVATAPKGKAHIVAHSETGHHHTVQADGVVMYQGPADPFTCYLRISAEYADVVHHRPFDTHETIRLGAGTWQVHRQREYTPEGFRMAQD
jgi:hypothetical protein